MMRSQPRFKSRAAAGSRNASTAPKRGSGEDWASNMERGAGGKRQEAKMPMITATTKSPNCHPFTGARPFPAQCAGGPPGVHRTPHCTAHAPLCTAEWVGHQVQWVQVGVRRLSVDTLIPRVKLGQSVFDRSL